MFSSFLISFMVDLLSFVFSFMVSLLSFVFYVNLLHIISLFSYIIQGPYIYVNYYNFAIKYTFASFDNGFLLL